MHARHTKIARPDMGTWGRQEWAILGTPCEPIRSLAEALAQSLSPSCKVGYADADHADARKGTSPLLPFTTQYTDKIDYTRFDRQRTLHLYEARMQMREADIVLVNGNHFTARRQILVLDRRKMDSLSRKTERLTEVDLLITLPDDAHGFSPEEMPSFLKEHLPHWRNIPVRSLSDTDAIAALLQSRCAPPPVHGLVLAGGRSLRMGSDKSNLRYHNAPQWQHLREIMHTAGIEKVYISCRPEQAGQFEEAPLITDTFTELGPFGAILSAFRYMPDAAWLVAACDLPLADAGALRYLLHHRQTTAAATAFRQPAPPEGWDAPAGETGFPEPLLAIWEPKQYPLLLMMLSQGISCPRKVLLQSDTCLLDAPSPEALLNVNTPEEANRMAQWLLRDAP